MLEGIRTNAEREATPFIARLRVKKESVTVVRVF